MQYDLFLTRLVQKVEKYLPRLIYSSHSIELSQYEIETLWPIWINDYTKLKAWTDKNAYQRRLALGRKYIFPVIGSQISDQEARQFIGVRNASKK